MNLVYYAYKRLLKAGLILVVEGGYFNVDHERGSNTHTRAKINNMKHIVTYQSKSGKIEVREFVCSIENLMYILRDSEIINLVEIKVTSY